MYPKNLVNRFPKNITELTDNPQLKNLSIEAIKLDGGTQIREKIDPRIVAEYAEDMKTGAVFPPIVVFFDAYGSYHLADGFHRIIAAVEADKEVILSEVHQGSLRDAILYACGANAKHGLRRSNKDKRNSVLKLLGDSEWRNWSNREIARRSGVAESFVRKLKKETHCAQSAVTTYQNKHGSIATMNTENIGKPARELVEGSFVKVNSNYALRGGQIGKISYFPNLNDTIVIFSDKKRELIPKNQLEITDAIYAPTDLCQIPNLGPDPVPFRSRDNKQYTSTEAELDAKAEELGLGKNNNSVLPESDRLDDMQHSNPTDVDDRPFAIQKVENINPQLIVNNLALHAEYLGKEHYRAIAKTIVQQKPEVIEDVVDTFSKDELIAKKMFERLTNIYPHFLEEIEQF